MSFLKLQRSSLVVKATTVVRENIKKPKYILRSTIKRPSGSNEWIKKQKLTFDLHFEMFDRIFASDLEIWISSKAAKKETEIVLFSGDQRKTIFFFFIIISVLVNDEWTFVTFLWFLFRATVTAFYRMILNIVSLSRVSWGARRPLSLSLSLSHSLSHSLTLFPRSLSLR